jgi:hypothetical protein
MSEPKKEMIEVHKIADMEELTRKAVFKAEGRMEEYPRQVGGDRTVTYGFGYTFIRYGGPKKGWKRYENLDNDLAAIGIKLTKTEKDSLDAIATARNNKKFSEVNKLISQFEKDWAKNHKPLTHDTAVTLFRQELSHKSNDINRRFKDFLGKDNGNKLYDHLKNSREIAGLYKMTYNSGAGTITKDLAGALFDGNRAKACSIIQHDSNKVQKRYLRGIAKERYLAASFIGYYFDPAHPTPKEVEDVLALEETKGKAIAQYEKGYRNPIFNAKRDFKDVLSEAKVTVTPFYDALKTAKNVPKEAIARTEAQEAVPVSSYQPAMEPAPVHAGKEPLQPVKEPVRPDEGLFSKIGEMGQRMHASDVDAAKAQTKIPELMGILLDKMFAPANSDASELSPLKTSNQQTMNQPGEQRNDYNIVPASELRRIAFGGLNAIDERKNVMSGLYSQKWGKPLAESMIEVAAGFSHLTADEQKTFIDNAVLSKEREDLNNETQQRNEIAEAYGYNRFYAKIPNFMKNQHQKDYDQWGRDLERKELDLSRREAKNGPEMEKVLAKVRTPEFQEKREQTFGEFKTKEAERLKDLAELDKEWDSYADRKFCINRLIDSLPKSIGNMGIKVKGDPTDIDNLLAQSKQIGAQTEPAIEMTRQYERGMQWT